ncbi:ferrous iron transport protein B [Prevotella sp. P4-98]|uniref:ferrous iron transport protein B n=1 Tax=Prevotella sp. P4-98 TaxID=2024219 RepID=UPI000B95F636|nr:ferrous iron transport protein B [Prevotella sp. P4-98]OYP48386.1 ferrous iron transport protein B [Prevotella sp. P4-98]
MKLSDLKTGQHATIVTVQGHGSFRKRIVEMGFVRGKDVEVLLNAPLQDPVKYKVMGYEISLRRQEAEMIVVDTDPSHQQPVVNHETMTDTVQDTCDQSLPAHVGNTINVALIGNPNCGKTSLFNFASGAHGHVGNYSGVTVDASEARATCDGFVFNLTDLPGTYSLSCYSPEELYVREHLMKRHPDVVINVIDSSNLERNLYLTTQLVDMNVRMVCALNMYDEFERRGDTLDTQTLSTLFGVPFVCTSFKSGRGVQELFREVISVFEDCNASVRHIHINHGHEIESGIAHIQQYLKRNEVVRTLFSTRYMAIKLLEHDDRAEAYVAKMENAKEIMAARDAAELRVKEEKKTDSETAIMDAKYGFIHGALTEAGFRQGTKEDTYRMTHFIDDVLSNKYLGFPIFFLILYVMFQTTFSLGQYPMDWIESAVSWLGEQASALMPEGPLRSMLVDGVIGGVGAVIVFLPQILILYFFISLMEDSGYMARAAFIMDKLMHKMGLHGKSFIPLIMGFGCNVPAIMATRTIESRRSRLITILILPFMSCSARLPIYIMIIGTFFAAQYRSWVMIMLYVIGVIVAIIVSKVFSSFVVKGEDTPFVMELPPYRWPTPKAIGRHTWEKGKEYLKKMGGIILVASIVVWALGYFPHDESLSPVQQKEQSYIGSIGKAVEPVFELQGFNWKLDVSLIAGVGAKEIVASTIGVIYSGDDSFGDDDSFSDDTAKYSRLRNQMLADGITPLAAFSYLLFVLLYFPCIATVIAIRNETGSWSWAAFSAFYTTAIAWIVSMLVYQIGSLF